MGHFCSECSIPPPEGVRGWVHGHGGVGLWEAGPRSWVWVCDWCACCEDYDLRLREFESLGFLIFLFDFKRFHLLEPWIKIAPNKTATKPSLVIEKMCFYI